eukprot:scaffold63425_cov60-Phaeocystis_antarctica.AAC.2
MSGSPSAIASATAIAAAASCLGVYDGVLGAVPPVTPAASRTLNVWTGGCCPKGALRSERAAASCATRKAAAREAAGLEEARFRVSVTAVGVDGGGGDSVGGDVHGGRKRHMIVDHNTSCSVKSRVEISVRGMLLQFSRIAGSESQLPYECVRASFSELALDVSCLPPYSTSLPRRLSRFVRARAPLSTASYAADAP